LANQPTRIQTNRETISGTPHAAERIAQTSRSATIAALFKRTVLPGSPDVAISIGTYRWDDSGQQVDFQMYDSWQPKSKVSLDPAAAARLIDFLSAHYPTLKAGFKRFVDVSGYQGDLDSVLDLVLEKHKQGLVSADFLLAFEVQERRRQLVEMKERMAADFTEPDWQRWFESHDWIIGGCQAVALDERNVDTENQTDYLLKAEDGFLDIVEIKRPTTPFWQTKKDHDNWVASMELLKAITQGTAYAYACEKKSDSIDAQRRFKAAVARPSVLVVCGRSETWGEDKFEAQRLLNSTLHGIRVITYDQLLARAERMLPTAV
jgi:hypothetical protein